VIARLLAAALALGLGACATTHAGPPPKLATFHVARDFETYNIHRVGLMPFDGDQLSLEEASAMQMAFLVELSRTAPFELVLLDAADLEEVRESEPYERGWYRPKTIIEVTRRYSLDAVMFGTVVQQQHYPPQMLSVQMDMVAAETGLVVWTAAVHLDANDAKVQQGLRSFYGVGGSEDVDGEWSISLLSPRRFARFAAWQLAAGL
jgi:hypothetical protein